LTFALWADRVSIKRALGLSPFELVYGTNAVFPTSLGIPVMNLLHEQETKINHAQRRINQMIQVHQTREEVYNKAQVFQEKMKNIFDSGAKQENFQINDLVLRWDVRYEDKCKHRKFDHLWKGPYKIATGHGNNTFIMHSLHGEWVDGGPVNGWFLKLYVS